MIEDAIKGLSFNNSPGTLEDSYEIEWSKHVGLRASVGAQGAKSSVEVADSASHKCTFDVRVEYYQPGEATQNGRIVIRDNWIPIYNALSSIKEQYAKRQTAMDNQSWWRSVFSMQPLLQAFESPFQIVISGKREHGKTSLYWAFEILLNHVWQECTLHVRPPFGASDGTTLQDIIIVLFVPFLICREENISTNQETTSQRIDATWLLINCLSLSWLQPSFYR